MPKGNLNSLVIAQAFRLLVSGTPLTITWKTMQRLMGLVCMVKRSRERNTYGEVWKKNCWAVPWVHQGLIIVSAVFSSHTRVTSVKNWFSTRSTWFWPLAWSQTSALISVEEKNSFLFFHSFHSFSQRKANSNTENCHSSLIFTH